MDLTIEYEPINVSTHEFVVPERQLRVPDDMPRWQCSQAYSDLVGFILTLNEAVKNKKVSDSYHMSKMTERMICILEQLDQWIEEIPAIDQPQRFGNKAFRTFYTKLKTEGPDLVKEALEPELRASVPEICTYLVESMGNDTRIDYGTGHELAFVAFLCCACKIGAFKEEDYPALVLKIFDRYLYLIRKLQMRYRMEPAGSQGVWSLDDYQFLPFLWGSAQLYDHPRLKPKSFPEEDIYNSFYKDYLFLAAVKYINQVKSGPFAEHSNQLWGISGVASWTKVNSGLIKMYKAEVLGKFPVVQHFLFGSLLTLERGEPFLQGSFSTTTGTACNSSPMNSMAASPRPSSHGISSPTSLASATLGQTLPPLFRLPQAQSPTESQKGSEENSEQSSTNTKTDISPNSTSKGSS